MAQITLKSQQKMGNEDTNKFFLKWRKNELWKKISETKDPEYIHELLSSTLEASPDITGDKLPRIGSILPNISPIEKPDKEEAIENMKTRFKI